MTRLKLFVSDRTDSLRRRTKALDDAIEGWARKTYDTNPPKAKKDGTVPGQTWNLPNGKVSLRAAVAHIIVDDIDALHAWCVAEEWLGLLRIDGNLTELAKLHTGPPAESDVLAILNEQGITHDQPGTIRFLVDNEGEFIPGVHSFTADAPTFTPIKP